MAEFYYQKPFELGEDQTPYRLLTSDHIRTIHCNDREILDVEDEALTLLAREAMKDVSFLLRGSHLEKVASILKDTEASDNDRYVARTLLNNSIIAAEMELPTCQDTGTAVVLAKRGQNVFTSGRDEEAISRGIFHTYAERNLRYSQVAPLTMYEEKNTGCNLPAQIDIIATAGDEYSFLFLAKGGGSANKTYLYQETRALLNPKSLEAFLTEKIKGLGTAACPPYHIAIVIGGTSAEMNMKTIKLASAGYYDTLPDSGNEHGRAFRDSNLENRILQAAQKIGLGAQFGGKYLAHDIRVVRLPRHGASLPIGLGVSCSADRNIKAKITKEGIFLEQLETNPARFLPAEEPASREDEVVHIDLNQSMDQIRAVLTRYPVRTRVMLTGRLIVARDIAHAKIRERLESGQGIPNYFKNHIIYYAGPAKTPPGLPSGSFGPTTAGRMDSYIPLFQEQGASLVTLAKGNRSDIVTESCRKYGGFYLGSIGGPAAILAKNHIKKVEVVEYPELGMEAVWGIDVENFPAFIVVDDKGNDFFKMI